MSQGYMTTVELATCRVPEDSASPASVCVWVGGGGLRRGVHGVLQVGIWYGITSISPFPAAIL
jgi:hypothetical protein